jgi:RNA recognition motif-containing protein
MGKKLYVGGLPYETTEDQLHTMFAELGPITKTQLITDRETGRSKGFGFVEYQSDEAALAAIQKFNGSALGARTLTVNEARPMEKRPGGFGGDRAGGGGGGGGGGRGGGYGRDRR